jgi:hypothetical protein
MYYPWLIFLLALFPIATVVVLTATEVTIPGIDGHVSQVQGLLMTGIQQVVDHQHLLGDVYQVHINHIIHNASYTLSKLPTEQNLCEWLTYWVSLLGRDSQMPTGPSKS